MPHQYSNTRRAEPILSELELYSEYRNCDRWAIIVGISRYRYQGWNLRYADRDAEELYNLLLTPSGGNFKKEFICKLTNEEATTGNITRALRAFLKKPAREDLVVIYFACHGTPDFDRPGNVYLLTHDTAPDDIAGTALPMREIDLSLKENLHAEKVIVLADTCHSAAIGGGIGRRSAVDDFTLVNRYLQEVSQARGGIALLTSAEANEVSFEDARWGGGHGVFTHYLLEGMRGAADRDGNGIVTVGELFEYVRDNVKRATDYRQHPLIGANAYDRNLPMAIVPSGDIKNQEYQIPVLKKKENLTKIGGLTSGSENTLISSSDLTDRQKRRLSQDYKALEEERDLLGEKLSHLRKAQRIETDPSNLFKLEKQIEQSQTELDQIDQQLEVLENKLNRK
jgi:polyhydroxyalkanoate synthesis regulator phasin